MAPPRSNGSRSNSAVGVEHHRDRQRLQQEADELARALASAQPRAQRHRVGALGRLQDRVQRPGPIRPPASSGSGPLDRLEQPGLEHRQRRLGRGDGDVAGIGPEGRHRRQHRSPRQPARAADHEHRPGPVLGALGGLARHGRQAARPGRARARAPAGASPISATSHRAAEQPPRATATPTLAAPKLTVTVARTAAPGPRRWRR